MTLVSHSGCPPLHRSNAEVSIRCVIVFVINTIYLSSPSAIAPMVYPQLGTPLEVLEAEHQPWKYGGPVTKGWVKPLLTLGRGRLSALCITFTWGSHQVFEVKTFHLVSERFIRFKELEIQVKVIVRTDDSVLPACWSCQCQFSVIWLIPVWSAYVLTI